MATTETMAGVRSMLDELEFGWREALAPKLAADAMAELADATADAYRREVVYPPRQSVFRAFSLTPFARVRAVILGQDPYHGPGQATGLSFAVPNGTRPPPSLRNIMKEVASDVGAAPRHTDLEGWAQQGVLLLNTTLTVADGQPNSHQGHGWTTLTDAVVAALGEGRDGLVFMLWGNAARTKAGRIDSARHRILAAAHPSPLSASRGFFGCRHFSLANAYLQARGEPPIDWGAA